MTNHNIKFSVLRSDIDLKHIQEILRENTETLALTGLQIKRFHPRIKSRNDNTLYTVALDPAAIQMTGQKILEQLSLDLQIPFLKMGLRVGGIRKDQILWYIAYGCQSPESVASLLSHLAEQIRENLPFAIEQAYSNVNSPEIHGDIVAMNSSTLREIIAHD